MELCDIYLPEPWFRELIAEDLADGEHTIQARAIHPTSGKDPSPATWTWTVDTQSPPVARIVAGQQVIVTGQSGTLDANASTDHQPDGSIVSYEFDPEGDGTFTPPTSSPTAAHVYDERGTYIAAVRVTNANGKSATASVPIEVRLAPPPGPLGVSINDGAQYTNDPNVTISSVWPDLATNLTVSNDGGFKNSQIRVVNESVEWKFDSSGPERLPKTIYVRFTGGSAGAETYQDDIILDETRPVISSASIGAAAASASSFSAGISSAASISMGAKIRLKASDRTSGVAFTQTAVNKKKPSKKVKYTSLLKVSGAVPKFVRVQDRAGNYSGWKKVKKPKNKKKPHRRR